MPPLRVALVGGGLGGLAFAITLLRAKERENADIDFALYEGAAKFMEIGAGIGMGINAVDCLRYMGLEKEYLGVYEKELESCQWRYGEDGRPMGDNDGLMGESILLHSAVHRADLLDIMIKAVPESHCHFGKRLATYTNATTTEPIQLTFQDGTTAVCDILVGADGIKSVVRSGIFDGSSSVDPIFTGTTASRGILKMDLMTSIVGYEQAHHPQMYLGRDSHILIFPIQHDKAVNVVAFATDRSTKTPIWDGGAGVAPISNEKLVASFPKWSEKCLGILKAIESPSRWALFELPDLSTHFRGSVCLIGDSAHGTLPHQGAGAGQAIEDGVILGELLCSPLAEAANIPLVLQVYDDLRRERSTKVKTTSNELGQIMEFSSEEFGDFNPDGIIANLQVRYDWIWEWRADKHVKIALDTLNSAVAKN